MIMPPVKADRQIALFVVVPEPLHRTVLHIHHFADLTPELINADPNETRYRIALFHYSGKNIVGSVSHKVFGMLGLLNINFPAQAWLQYYGSWTPSKPDRCFAILLV